MNDTVVAPPRRLTPPTTQASSHDPQGAFRALSPALQRAVAVMGYAQPTPIQEQAIRPLLAGRDLLGIAQTGTGKTAAFTLPLLQHLSEANQRPRPGTPQALILAPTRELAAQIDDSLRDYGRFLRLRHAVVFGGVSQFRQVKALRRGVNLVVATPGRLLDLMQQGHIRLDRVSHFVLDEVDRMLDMGFLPDIKRVLARLPEKRQTLFFSATLPPAMARLAATMVRDPVRVNIAPERPAVERIAQRMLFVERRNKDALLVSVLRQRQIGKALVFTQMKHAANRVVKRLQAAGIEGVALHGNKSQAARTRALAGFKHGHFQVLVATDVAARGLDVDDITHVINYDLPVEPETYVHRIGRTARAGADGDAISFCTATERGQLQNIERLLGQPVEVDAEHAFHCEATFRAAATPPPAARSHNQKHGGQPGTRRGRQPGISPFGKRPSRPRRPNRGHPRAKFV